MTSFMPTCQWQGVMMASFPNDGLAPRSCGADSCGIRKALTPSGEVLNFETHAIPRSNFCKFGKYNVSSALFIAALRASDSGAAKAITQCLVGVRPSLTCGVSVLDKAAFMAVLSGMTQCPFQTVGLRRHQCL